MPAVQAESCEGLGEEETRAYVAELVSHQLGVPGFHLDPDQVRRTGLVGGLACPHEFALLLARSLQPADPAVVSQRCCSGRQACPPFTLTHAHNHPPSPLPTLLLNSDLSGVGPRRPLLPPRAAARRSGAGGSGRFPQVSNGGGIGSRCTFGWVADAQGKLDVAAATNGAVLGGPGRPMSL